MSIETFTQKEAFFGIARSIAECSGFKSDFSSSCRMDFNRSPESLWKWHRLRVPPATKLNVEPFIDPAFFTLKPVEEENEP